MKSFSTLALITALAAAQLGLPAQYLQAAQYQEPIDMSGVNLQPQEQNGVSYVIGGIGLDESRAIQQVQGYNLHLTFSTGPQNEYVPDVDLTIQGGQGQALLQLNQVGPMVYVKLPPGRYNLLASRNGEQQMSAVTLVPGQTGTVNLHWKQDN
ncbi:MULTISPECIES: carboxypeptidase-like regulatory domain-containing protein [Pseudomonas]|uniref:carboxypeptidase-like regulatory domain-containing protein n=1 Tax=Pseudomonas TaxID=286 RepID=UPI0020B704AA|nr:carboxypeptidase-like regulatory domain-containing protein [Pseudomonas sp. SBB6]MCP3749559.1 carboxypeptidase-like regulatory domain-containing protein [Pseudomonas sp. SBB6]WSE84652.1 carboxypeptidase-like regulatory domain-containing protein [Pseudomonas donghuensis]